MIPPPFIYVNVCIQGAKLREKIGIKSSRTIIFNFGPKNKVPILIRTH